MHVNLKSENQQSSMCAEQKRPAKIQISLALRL